MPNQQPTLSPETEEQEQRKTIATILDEIRGILDRSDLPTALGLIDCLSDTTQDYLEQLKEQNQED